jgi:putative transposase
MEADVEGLIGAGRHERSTDRLNDRNGCRDRSLDTRLGSLSRRIPQRRRSLPRRRRGTSTSGSTPSSTARSMANGRISGSMPPPSMPLPQCHLPQGARRRPHRLGGDDNCRSREYPGSARDRRSRHRSLRGRALWSGFLKGLVKRGLRGVKLVISDAHDGLRHAITRVLGATWQRGRGHWIRNALAHLPNGRHTMVAAAIRQAFRQADAEAARHLAPPGRSAAATLAQARCADG